jgi:hypothetical protein
LPKSLSALLLTWFAAGVLTFGASAPQSRESPIKAPHGKPVMIDGKLAAGEWGDARVVTLPGVARLFVKQSGEYVFLALELTNSDTGTVDLYVSPDDDIYDLHASAKLGERKLQAGKWPADWTWWNNAGWVANVSRVDSWDKRTFLPEKVREYQILRSRFPGKRWKIMFDFMTPAKPEWKSVRYPAGASDTDTKGWLVLELD